MPGMEPRDQAAQDAAIGADLAQQIAAEQRAIERSESQPQEQIPMIGPRGGITPEGQGRGTRRQPTAQPAAQPAAQETTLTTTTAERTCISISPRKEESGDELLLLKKKNVLENLRKRKQKRLVVPEGSAVRMKKHSLIQLHNTNWTKKSFNKLLMK